MKKLNKVFDNIYVLNRKSRPDRLHAVTKRLKGVNFEVWKAEDGADRHIKDFFCAHRNRTNIKTEYAFACVLSHYSIIVDAQQRQLKSILVLEDDVYPHVDFDTLFNLPKDWDIAYLGHSRSINGPLGTFAYALKANAYETAINELSQLTNPADIIFRDRILPKLKTHIFQPDLFIADLTESDIRKVANPTKTAQEFGWKLENYGLIAQETLSEPKQSPVKLETYSACSVAIIVTARNYGRFLRECLDSCLNQTVKPTIIVYSDDFSEDDSVKIARSYGKDVITVTYRKHTGVAASRNRGAAHAGEVDLYLFVDGDDILTPDYLEKHLEAITPTIPFVYGSAQAFGVRSNHWLNPDFNTLFIWDINFCNTTSLVWREVFEKAGRWKEPPHNTMWDWHLWLRCMRYGTPKPSKAKLMYRQHGGSWSDIHEPELKRRELDLLKEVRRDVANVTVAIVYGGRLPSIFKKILQMVKDDADGIEYNILIVNTSETELKLPRGGKFTVINVSKFDKPTEEMARRHAQTTYLADCYNIVNDNATGDIVWTIEDDVLPPPGTFRKMYNRLTAGIDKVPRAVSAMYKHRHDRVCAGLQLQDVWIGGNYIGNKGLGYHPIKRHDIEQRFDLAGNGCLMYWRLHAPRYRGHTDDGATAQDWAFCLDLQKISGQKILMMPIVCRHYITETKYV